MGIVVTLSRESGSNGEQLAREVAAALHLRLLDREIVHEAIEAGIPEDIALESEEGRHNLVHRALRAIRGRPPVPHSATITSDEPISSYITTDLPQPAGEYYRAILESVIFNMTQTEDILLIGRAGQVIFRSQPHCFRLRIVAPLDRRVMNVAEQMKVGPEEARRLVDSVDSARANYLQRHYGAYIADSSLYDLCLNTGTIPHDAALQIVLTAIRASLQI